MNDIETEFYEELKAIISIQESLIDQLTTIVKINNPQQQKPILCGPVKEGDILTHDRSSGKYKLFLYQDGSIGIDKVKP